MLRKGLVPIDIQRPSLGVNLLGGAVSRDADFFGGLGMRKAANAVDLMSLLQQLHDPQIVQGHDLCASVTIILLSCKATLVCALRATNYGSWEFFFEQLCSGCDVEKYIHSPTNEVSSSTLAPLTPEELKVDKIVLSWIFTTFSDALQARLVVARLKSDREAWVLISDIVKDNKRSRTNALKAELHSIKLGDQSMESYFLKIESIVTILKSLDSHLNDEDVVHYALEGLPDKYDQMRLKSKALALLVDSSSPMVLMAELGNNHRSSTTPQVKSWRPCFNFAKGACRFGESCRYVHDVNAKSGPNNNASSSRGCGTLNNTTNDLLNKLLQQLGNMHVVNPTIANTLTPSPAVAFTDGPTSFASQPASLVGLPGFPHPYHYIGPTATYPIQSTQPGNVGSNLISSQDTILPHAFNTETLQDPASGAWNIDIGNGSTQLEVVDFDETFSPIVKPGTIRTVLSLAASRHWPIHQLDVKNAFLHASLESLLQQIIRSLHHEFAMTDLGPLNYFLGISVTRDSSGLFLSQKKYAIEILDRAHMNNCNPSRTPIDTESKLGSDGDLISDPTLYRSLVGSLQYLTFTRPDISYAVQQVCLYMPDHQEPHFSALKRILLYVHGTLDYGLLLFSSSTIDLVAYSDVDWAGCPTTRCSTSEMEYRGVADVVAETCWLRNLLRELHTPLSSAMIVYCDNFADIFTKGLPSALFEEFRSSLSV
ncbi:ribonuclease H-like domain-containing protein [Tanacetum coccineum]|uniref:Ribonuclease H-like domain-containing protein n=1 Tax=Tanacetum coccineum TaxID=301880 RepID=A0ABQ4WM63_9ASTR